MKKYYIFSILAICIFSILIYISVKILFLEDCSIIVGRLYFKKKYTNKMNKFTDRYANDKLRSSGFSIALKEYYKIYEKIRVFIILLLFLYLVKIVLSKRVQFSNLIIITVLLSFIYNKLMIGKYLTPVGFLFRELDKYIKGKIDKEICSIIVQLRNISESNIGNSFNLSHMLTSISRFADLTKNAFTIMILNINTNDTDIAKQLFDEETGTELAKDFSSILIKLDYIQPKEVKKQLRVLEEKARNHNEEIRYKNAEFISNILYLLPTVLCFIILMNFLNITISLVSSLIPM